MRFFWQSCLGSILFSYLDTCIWGLFLIKILSLNCIEGICWCTIKKTVSLSYRKTPNRQRPCSVSQVWRVGSPVKWVGWAHSLVGRFPVQSLNWGTGPLTLVGQFHCLVGRFHCLVGQFLCLVGQFPSLVCRFHSLAGRFQSLAGRVHSLVDRFHGLASRVYGLAGRFHSLAGPIHVWRVGSTV